jgi:CyaY protein
MGEEMGADGVACAGLAAGRGVPGKVSGARCPQALSIPPQAATQTSAVGIHPHGRPGRRANTTLEQTLSGIQGILPIMTTPAVSDAQYRQIAADTLSAIESQIDQWLEADLIDIDTHRTGGLLELSFPNGSKIILNTQPPLQELWLAAKGGGFHFKLQEGRWVDTRDGSPLGACLNHHASAQAGKPLQFPLG